MSPLPPEPWYIVHIDFCRPFPSGELERIFAIHGILRVIIKSDNGLPFTSHEFHSYVTKIGAKHQKITPLWPQADSEAENFMKPLTKAVRAAHREELEGRNIHFSTELQSHSSHHNWFSTF